MERYKNSSIYFVDLISSVVVVHMVAFWSFEDFAGINSFVF